MNLEEAHNNIGAEIELDESTKPYTCTLRTKGYYEHGYGHIEQKIQGAMTLQKIDDDGDALIEGKNGARENIHPRHLKLKPQNYKIHVPTEEESREAQRLFFELGINWHHGNKILEIHPNDYIFSEGSNLSHGLWSHAREEKQITLQDLRDMVAKKKLESKCFDEAVGSNPLLKVKVECKEMTWEDALRAVADGKRVEVYNHEYTTWQNIDNFSISIIKKKDDFRIAPQRIILNGEYTKEELLQKIGEME